jgi:hypothetical protein
MTFDAPAIIAVGVYDFPLVDKYDRICIRVPTDFFQLLRRPTCLFWSFKSHPVFAGVLSESNYIKEEDERKKENVLFHHRIPITDIYFDYLIDILRISISLSEVSSVMVGPPPFSV